VKVLHIEDRRENRLLVRKLLESRGWTVVDAGDGLIGLELARKTDPALILVDINIPGLDGYEVVSRLKGDSAFNRVPVVAITAEGDRDRALALGFDGFIAKPIRLATFVGELQAFLGGKREAVAEDQRAAHLLDHGRKVVDRLEAKVRELTRANDRLREVDRLKMEVLRNVSHELSTPMTPLLGYVKMMAGGELGPVSDGQSMVLGRMDNSLGRLKTLIDNLLDVTRFATNAVSLQPSAFPAQAVVEDVTERLGSRAGAVVVRLGALEAVVADRGRLTDAVFHLIDNALKFGPKGGPVQVHARVASSGDVDQRCLLITVSDQGPGIPEAQHSQIIEPFYQIDGSTTRAHGGAGLGLSVVHRIATLHGGALVFGASPQGGASVTLKIPTRPPR
jgi:signal transduction histidine kinase